MRQKIYVVLLVSLFLFISSIALTYAQYGAEEKGQQVMPANETDLQWLWGEVVSVDSVNKTILVKYLDYETDTGKEITIGVDERTSYENIKSLDEVKVKDGISIDYIMTADGRSIARNISTEKPEEVEILPEDITEENTKGSPGMEQ